MELMTGLFNKEKSLTQKNVTNFEDHIFWGEIVNMIGCFIRNFNVLLCSNLVTIADIVFEDIYISLNNCHY